MNPKPSLNNKSESIYIDIKIAVAVAVTFVLFFCCLVGMFISLAVGNSDGGYTPSGDGGGGGGGKNNVTANSTPVNSNTESKTGIVLPCQTKDGTYLSASGGEDISGDTNIKSAAAVLVDITDNKTVAGKNADTRIYPASMTKVMTLLVACENAKDPTALLTLTGDMMKKYNTVKGSDSMGPSLELVWQEGYQVTVEDALYMVIYGSDTYACWLLADNITGSEEKFVELMNSKAKSLGLTQTNYTNCTGLYDEKHYTTCREMAAVMAAAMNNETAKTILTSISEYSVEVYTDGVKNDEASAKMYSNWYAGRVMTYKYTAPSGKVASIYVGNGSDVKFIAGKTGYETIPQASFVTVGMDDQTNRMYVCVQVNRIDKTQASLSTGEAVKQSTMDTRYIYYTYAKEKNND